MQKFTRQVNLLQFYVIQGYVTGLKYVKGALPRNNSLTFTLESSSINKDKEIFPLVFYCELPGRIAEDFANSLREEDLITVEGKIRQNTGTRSTKLIVVHISHAIPITQEFTISDPKE